MLRSLVGQLINQNKSLIGLIYDQFLMQGLSPSQKVLKSLIVDLLSGIISTRLILDGLDECTDDEQKDILSVLRFLIENIPDTVCVKIAVFSRDIISIKKALRSPPTISLKDEAAAVDCSIKILVQHELNDIRTELIDSYIAEDVFTAVEQNIVAKADGKS